MAFKEVISRVAQIHINDAFYYYESQQHDLGLRFFIEFKNAVRYILLDPYLFPVKSKNLRELKLSVFPYIIIYEIVDDIVIIAAVFHTSQNPKKKPSK
ncbi:type II toxin-antitoxin system RelE/ParE family toxin [Flavobacterium sp. MFBS3-15]|uniref:type II toxin-antitoxin system RelE/ParE family toxin n=1 Tax=Flavobacterium sp. MFBS3-15 TaxID=2989816 RepID=UPI00355799B0